METSERISAENIATESEYLMYLRHIFAYTIASKLIPDGSFVLDIGCGNGYGIYMLSQRPINIIGLDVNRKTIDRAIVKYKSKNCNFQHYGGQTLPFADSIFDIIISFQVIEHIKSEQRYLLEINRVLKPDGMFVLTTPNKALRMGNTKKPWNKYHFKEYFSHELTNALTGYFSQVDIFGIRGSDIIQEKEKNRIKKILRMVSLDPLNIRSLIPETIKQKMISALQKNKNLKNYNEMYGLDDYKFSNNNIDTSLDLVAICKK